MKEQAFLDGESAAESGKGTVRAHDTMSRDDDSERVGANCLSDSTGRLWPANGVSNVTVCPHCADRNLRERLPNATLEFRAAVHVQRAGEVHCFPVGVPREGSFPVVDNFIGEVIIQGRQDIFAFLFDEFSLIMRPQYRFQTLWRGDEAEESKRC